MDELKTFTDHIDDLNSEIVEHGKHKLKIKRYKPERFGEYKEGDLVLIEACRSLSHAAHNNSEITICIITCIINESLPVSDTNHYNFSIRNIHTGRTSMVYKWNIESIMAKIIEVDGKKTPIIN